MSQETTQLPVFTIKSQPMTIAKDPIVYVKYLFQEEIISDTTINDFISKIEIVYKGLGIPALYGALSILAGKSVLFIGGRGLGKTRLINCIPDFEDAGTSKWDTFTYNELDAFVAKNSTNELNVGVKNKQFVFKVEEFSTLSEYHRGIFLQVCSKICSDHNYNHVSQITPHLLIENCKLSMIIAVQPILYSKLCTFYAQWDSMSYDRFSKFLLLNPLRENNTKDVEIITTFPNKIPPTADIPSTVNIEALVRLFRGQVSEGRATLYAEDYAKAIARFQGKTEVSQEDINLFLKLFRPYLDSFSRLQERRDLDSPITISSGAMELLTEVGKHLEGITKQELAHNLMVSTRTIERGLEIPINRKLIRQEEDKYCLAEELEEHFKWYKTTFSSQMSLNDLGDSKKWAVTEIVRLTNENLDEA